jgi:hypothetical protein
MAKSNKSAAKTPSSPASTPTKTPVRRTVVPRKGNDTAAAAPAPRAITRDDIARRAYELFSAGAPGGELEHWLQAERELSGGR